MKQPMLSVALVCWQMPREIPRTLWSLSREFQRGMADIDYEIIVVDNGSDSLPPVPDMQPVPRICSAQNVAPSPVGAMNQALCEASGRLVGAWIDGARMASAGLLRAVWDASELHARPVIAPPNRQFGPDRQALSLAKGYSAEVEDRLLADAGWPSPDTDMFSVSAPEMSDITAPMLESNALFMTKDDWTRLDGFDPAFTESGGGAANPDVFHRAVAMSGTQLIRVSGEATFHQIHGGTTTDDLTGAVDAVKTASRNYFRLRGHPLRPVRERGWIFDPKTGYVDKGERD